MAIAVGPVFTGGFEEFVINDEANEEYTLSFLPDRNNDDLQREGKQPVFYYLPEQVRLARKGDKGDFKFRHIHFVGVFDETSVGVSAGETQGGVLAFTVTSRYPTSVLKQAEQQILQRFRGKNDKYWGIRTNAAPAIKMVPIISNTTAVSSVTPGADGSAPGDAAAATPQPGGAAAPAAGGNAGGGAGPAPGGNPAGGGGPAGPAGGGDAGDGGPRTMRGVVMRSDPWQPVPHDRAFRPSLALQPWAWKMEGQGPGSVTGGENAYAAIIGPLPSEIIWAGFHGAYSPIVVAQHLVMPMWSQQMRVKITGSWKRIFDHFSAAANAHYLWFAADIKAEFNNLRVSGDIKVEVDIDGTMPGGQEMEKAINQRIDLIVQQFTEQAKKVIFDPPPPNVQPAEAPSGGLFSSLFGVGGGGLALKMRHDSTQLDLSYEETRYFRYLQPHTISSSLEGFFNEIKRDPQAEQKYFMRLVLGGLGRKVMRICKPVVNWPDPARGWVGEPVAFLSAQIGYPGAEGTIQWKPMTFQKTDPPDTTFRPVWVEWKPGEVSNPPASWTPDQTYVKRKVHMLEPPGETDYPFLRVAVERNDVDLDPGPNGTLSNDNILEVRADQVGRLDVGPLALGAMLSSNAEVVEVEFRAKGKRADGTDRMQTSTRMRWSFADQDEPRLWRIFTGQPDFVPAYQYRVHVTVKGTLTTKGQAWSGPWVEGGGNGALMVDVPGPDDAGVVKRSLTSREIFSDAPVRAADTMPAAQPEPGVPVFMDITPVAPAAPGAPAPAETTLEAPRSAFAGSPPPAPPGSGIAPPRMPATGDLRGSPPKATQDRSVQGYTVDAGDAGAGTGRKAPDTRKRAGRTRSAPAEEDDAGEWTPAPSGSSQQSASPRNPRSTAARGKPRAVMAPDEPEEWVAVPEDTGADAPRG